MSSYLESGWHVFCKTQSGMYKGIYIALSGAVLKGIQMEVITQNLANGNTVGYKKSSVSFEDYLIPRDMGIQKPDPRDMSRISSQSIDFSGGDLVYTGNPLDIALEGDGFIALEGNLYTRRGDLKIDGEGFLTNHSGIRVLGSGGKPIRVPDGNIKISDNGTISVDNGNGEGEEEVGSIRVVGFPKKENLLKTGEGTFSTGDSPIGSKAVVKQGYLETSNVDIVMEMFQMMKTLREFETYQKAIQVFDEASAKINNEIARI